MLETVTFLKSLTIIFVVMNTLTGQETRQEITHPSPNPQDDTRSNSSQVPDVYAMSAHFDRIVILRFKYDTDLLAGLEKMVKQQGVRNAVILSAFGSVRGYQVHQVSNRDFPSKDMYIKNPTAPADIISMNGFVIGGRLHPHITLANPEKAFGGHLEPGTKVFTFAVVTLGVLDGSLDLTRIDDKDYR